MPATDYNLRSCKIEDPTNCHYMWYLLQEVQQGRLRDAFLVEERPSIPDYIFYPPVEDWDQNYPDSSQDGISFRLNWVIRRRDAIYSVRLSPSVVNVPATGKRHWPNDTEIGVDNLSVRHRDPLASTNARLSFFIDTEGSDGIVKEMSELQTTKAHILVILYLGWFSRNPGNMLS
ncbi:hypothetical protein BDZ91DRAFT_762830 [Kalaharituber pfeilii]|nr:hypothetical protein BDZ91DRAFT_762830 [Kalaharituber pfeilii]